jgi:hypothetical protein
MNAKLRNSVGTAFLVVWAMLGLAHPSVAEVTFFVEREGSPGDNGLTLFRQAAGPYQEQDFEDPDLGESGTEVPELWFQDLGLALTGNWVSPAAPTIFASSAFAQEGKLFNRALLPGFALTVEPVEGVQTTAVGMWIFDDGGSFDAAYLVQVVEADGTVWEAELENEIDRDGKGHEIEGFIGAVSDIGIASFTVTPIDPETGEAVYDVFETDHWHITIMPAPAEECGICGDLDFDDDVDADDYAAFLGAFGTGEEDAEFVPCADLDDDGMITFVDFQGWLQCYRDYRQIPPRWPNGRIRRLLRPASRDFLRLHNRLFVQLNRLKDADLTGRAVEQDEVSPWQVPGNRKGRPHPRHRRGHRGWRAWR